MVRICIQYSITWADQLAWIVQNCKNYHDVTNWQSWCLGVHPIYYELTEKDATLFHLRWS